MKSIRISDKAYKFLQAKAKKDRRTIIDTIDIVVERLEKKANKGE